MQVKEFSALRVLISAARDAATIAGIRLPMSKLSDCLSLAVCGKPYTAAVAADRLGTLPKLVLPAQFAREALAKYASVDSTDSKGGLLVNVINQAALHPRGAFALLMDAVRGVNAHMIHLEGSPHETVVRLRYRKSPDGPLYDLGSQSKVGMQNMLQDMLRAGGHSGKVEFGQSSEFVDGPFSYEGVTIHCAVIVDVIPYPTWDAAIHLRASPRLERIKKL